MSEIRVLVEFKELRSDAMEYVRTQKYDYISILTDSGGRICITDPNINTLFGCAEKIMNNNNTIIGFVGDKLVGGMNLSNDRYRRLIEFGKKFGGLGVGIWLFKRSTSPFNEYVYKKLLTIE